MVENKLEKTLLLALNHSHLSELPDSLKPTTRLWLKAIVLVAKRDGSRNYAIAENNGDDTPNIVKDFGNVSQIAKVEGIYPFLEVENARIPDMRNKSEIVDLLVAYGFNAKEITYKMANKHIDGTMKSADEIARDKYFIKFEVNKITIEQEKARLKETKGLY